MNWKIYALAACSLALGAGGLYALFTAGPAVAAACHLVSAGIGYHAAVLSDSRRSGSHVFQLALSLCMPFFGAAAAVFLFEAVKSRKTGRLADEFAVYLNDAASFRESVPITDADAPESEEIVPLADILAHPVSEAEQRIAVENLISMETPAAMDVLRRVIESDSGEGRFFAMTALGQMEERMLAKLQGLEDDLETGRDAGVATMMSIARTYIDFSYYQLAQDERRNEYLDKARALLERVLASDSPDPEAHVLLGRIDLFRYDAESALRRFNAYLAENPGNRAGLLWRAEAWYMLCDYAKVREDCRAALATGERRDGMRDTAIFWASALKTPGKRSRTETPAATGGPT